MNGPASLADPLDVGGVRLPNRVLLAPMSGVTDEPFRARAVSAGAGLAVSEMIASGELVKGRSAQRLKRPDTPVHMVQLAGRDAALLGEAARIAVGEGADLVDFNMGCPAKKVTGGACGSALMREPDHAARLIGAIVEAVSVPVTVKMRLGWDADTLNAPGIARRAESLGVAMITVHGRTRVQFYTGAADWSAVRRVREATRLPLVVNGDIRDAATAAQALAASGADAVMVGRAAYGQPWLPGALAQARAATAPADLFAYVSAHYEAMLALYGREGGLRHARKHLGWYLDQHAPDTPALLRVRLMTSVNPDEVLAGLADAFATPSLAAAA